MEKRMYLVTGATGNIGSRVSERLVRAGERPKVLVRDLPKAKSRFGDTVDIVNGDLGDPESLRAAFSGVDAIFLVNSGPEIPSRDALAAEIATNAGVQHIVKLSALSASQQLAIGEWHARGEAAIRASGIAYTFVRPAGFMSNTLEWARSIRAEGVVRACTGEGKVAYIHPDDVAAVAATVLTSKRYSGESLHITGPRLMSYAEMTESIGAAVGKSLRFESITDADALLRLRATGMPTIEAEALVSLWRHIRQAQLATVTDCVQQILGHAPVSFDQWVKEHAAAYC